MKIFLLIIITIILISSSAVTEAAEKNLSLDINTIEGKICINNILLENPGIKTIEKILGRPDRTEKVEKENLITEFPLDENDTYYTYRVKVSDYYYIYDKAGIMFHTKNGTWTSEEPVLLTVFFDRNREFTNMELPEFTTEKKFLGTIKINGMVLEAEKSVISGNINYKTEKFEAFNTFFAPTSFTTLIDSIYTWDGLPVTIFLNNGRDRKVSYIQISLPGGNGKK